MINVPNPWKALPDTARFVLPDDEKAIDAFNKSAKLEFQVHLDILPEPYLGRPDAPVVLLNLNPGFKGAVDVEHHGDAFFAKRHRENLLHKEVDYPFYLIDPHIAKKTAWWTRRLRALIEQFDARTVARQVLCVEYFPYHSKKFKHRKCQVSSQQYSFDLVRAAVQRRAIILVMRSEKLWLEAVPELQSYDRFFRGNSVQNPAISPRNFPTGFAAATQAISYHSSVDVPSSMRGQY